MAKTDTLFINATKEIAFTTGTAVSGLVGSPTAIPGTIYPLNICLLSDQDVYIQQGGSAVVFGSGKFLLKANTYFFITITNVSNAYVITQGVSAAGTLRASDVSSAP